MTPRVLDHYIPFIGPVLGIERSATGGTMSSLRLRFMLSLGAVHACCLPVLNYTSHNSAPDTMQLADLASGDACCSPDAFALICVAGF